MCEEKEKEKDLNISVEKLLTVLKGEFKRLDGDFKIWNKKYKYSAYIVPMGVGIITYRIDVREVEK